MWSSLLAQIQTQPWLQALLTGSGLCALFWLIDHAGAHAMVRYIPIGTPVYRRNLTGILRRVLLLCAAGLLAVGDYLILLPSAWQSRLPLLLVALPIAAAILVVWLLIESRLVRHVIAGDTALRSWWQQYMQTRSPSTIGQEPSLGLLDFLRLTRALKQRIYGSEAYGGPSQRLNQLLYLLTWAHLVAWVYALRMQA
ncbi:hypothetical protein HNP33_000054 [Comamonas odontotermitis]|uniref:Uncharacterized protein n=1 Tax=Comamonas odontotermitis TaxID=379895 RepID=A0ABR6RA30_9BURK|nr:hypothetical protein [Comamonas odontotermitis]MBB6576006.1 hypothetical protein [Comamonas odontotermitis]